MKPAARQVKHRSRRVAALALSAWLLAALGCAESRAMRLYDEGQDLVSAGSIAEAVERYEEILRRYPETEAAVLARRDVEIYRSLAGAIDRFPVRSAFDVVVGTARAIEGFRARQGRFPESLEALVPRDLDTLPVDPWGRPLTYDRRGRGYVLYSLGSDGAVGGVDDAQDLIIESGRFVRRPSGEQL